MRATAIFANIATASNNNLLAWKSTNIGDHNYFSKFHANLVKIFPFSRASTYSHTYTRS